MLLMLKDKEVLWFDTLSFEVIVLNEKLLPFYLQGKLRTVKTVSDAISNYNLIRNYFANRTLLLSRQNIKALLQSINNSQRLTEEESFQLSLKCKGGSIHDSYWVKEDSESVKYKDIDIRRNRLSDLAFKVAMKGAPISIQRSLLSADLTTTGMFRKCWVREPDGLYLYKSDKTNNYLNTKMEIEISQMLQPYVIEYTQADKEGVYCCKCKCFTNDDNSFVEAESLPKELYTMFPKDFANMVVIDYVIANPDRHNANWGFMYDTDSNTIKSMAKLFDHNQAGIALLLGKEKEFDELIYPPTGLTMRESVCKWKHFSTVDLSQLTEPYGSRFRDLEHI